MGQKFSKNDKAVVCWLTGLSGSGKSTIADSAKDVMSAEGRSVCILDGDDMRDNKHEYLDFSVEGIKENNRLIANLCKEKLYEYDCIFVSVIAPFSESRRESRQIIGDNYYEVYVKASLDTVMKRDAKGLYKKALSGQIKNFIGLDPKVPYHVPLQPDLVLDTEAYSVEELSKEILSFVKCIE